MSDLDLSCIIPVYNEAGNIADVVAEVRAALEGVVAYEIVFVDDGSDDGTAGEIDAEATVHDVVRVVRHVTRGGKSRALINGAKAARGRFMATMDGDGQDDPINIVKMWKALCESGQPEDKLLVCGWRRARKDSFWRRFVSRIANRVRRWFLDDDTPDTACGLKLMNREAFLDLPRFENMHRYFPVLFARRGHRVISVPVIHRPRNKGVSKYGTLDRLWAGIWDLLGVMWILKRMRYSEVTEEKDWE